MNETTREVTLILRRIDDGDPQAPAELLPLVYDELRRLAAGHMANEAAGHTLDATALVHEAYLRLAAPSRGSSEPAFANRGHFFAAAAEAMRRILVDSARRKRAAKRGGGRRVELAADEVAAPTDERDRWLELDEAVAAFEAVDPPAAALAKLRVFGGLTIEEAGDALGLPRTTAHRQWTYAKAWLSEALAERA